MQDAAATVPLPAPPAPSSRRPAAWPPLLLAAAVMVIYLTLQMVISSLGWMLLTALEGAGAPLPSSDRWGVLSWVGTALAAPVAAAAAAAAAVLLARPPGGVRELLGLRRPRLRPALGWLLAMLAVGWGHAALAAALGRPPVHPWTQQAFLTAGWVPGLVVTLVVLVPVVEEVLFRGLLLGGLGRSRLGYAGAVVLASLAWTLVHWQYDLFDLGAVFAFGLVLGTARWHTGSLPLAIGLHAAVNAVACGEALLAVEPL